MLLHALWVGSDEAIWTQLLLRLLELHWLDSVWLLHLPIFEQTDYTVLLWYVHGNPLFSYHTVPFHLQGDVFRAYLRFMQWDRHSHLSCHIWTHSIWYSQFSFALCSIQDLLSIAYGRQRPTPSLFVNHQWRYEAIHVDRQIVDRR